jgi:hypothetical protein
MLRKALLAIFAGLVLSTSAIAQGVSSLTPEEARKLAKEAYIFGFPHATNYRVFIQRFVTNDPLTQGVGFNEFAHQPGPFPPEVRDTTQRDTIFSIAVLDLRREPLVISVPKIPDLRAYMLQLGDTSTEALPYISTVATGNEAGNYVIVGPDSRDYFPARRFDGVITARGRFVIVIGRTMFFGISDLPNVHAIHRGIKITPLSTYLGRTPPPKPAPVEFIPWDNEKAAGLGIFDYINMAIAWEAPAHDEIALLRRIARIGIVPGKRFTTKGLPPQIVAALNAGIADARASIDNAVLNPTELIGGVRVGGWELSTKDISRFGNNFLLRAAVARDNIYPNAPDHAIYAQARLDASGAKLSGDKKYTVRFNAKQIPPVNWFWSVTMYDAKTTAMYPNPLKRYSIGDRTTGLRWREDGSLAISIQHKEPEDAVRRANWLPAPKGGFYMVMRLYGPKPSVVAGEWKPPPITKAK